MTRLKFVSIAFLGVLIAACGGGGGGGSSDRTIAPPPPPPPPVLGPDQAQTAQGIVEGVVEGDLVVFRGIRYAEPVTTAKRFMPPEPAPVFSGIYDATSFGDKCIQPQGTGTVGAEDCLFLNVWKRNDDQRRPVMVYMHPGASNGVGGDMASIDPFELVETEDLVVVTFNRRIGIMGHLALQELINENPQSTAGNYAIQDVIEALRWVNENIAAFNGDPNRVLLAGTSAGGLAACVAMGSDALDGLISAASVQSAPCSPAIVQKLADAVPFDSRFPPAVLSHRQILADVGCDGAANVVSCLRTVPASELALAGAALDMATPYMLFSPMIDGVVVEDDIYTALEDRTAGDIPFVVGVTANEVGSMWDPVTLPDDQSYRDFLARLFSDPLDDQLYALYPTANYPTPKDALNALWADVAYSCAAERLAQAAASGAPSYLYEISRGFDSGSAAGQGAVHAIDITYLFGNFDVFSITPDSQSLFIRDSMRAAWQGISADPTAAPPITQEGTTLWPVYDAGNATFTDFGDTVEGRNAHRDGRCAAVIDLLG